AGSGRRAGEPGQVAVHTAAEGAEHCDEQLVSPGGAERRTQAAWPGTPGAGRAASSGDYGDGDGASVVRLQADRGDVSSLRAGGEGSPCLRGDACRGAVAAA